jgi:proteasome maturation protein
MVSSHFFFVEPSGAAQMHVASNVVVLLIILSAKSLRIVPADVKPSSFSHIGAKQKGAPSAPGLHDTLRHGIGPEPVIPSEANIPANIASGVSVAAAVDSPHPLEARLKAWEATQENLRMESLRRTFGIAEPVRRGMELKIVRGSEWRPAVLGGGAGGLPSVHEDILRGRETDVTWEDVYSGAETRAVMPVHDEMERKLKM